MLSRGVIFHALLVSLAFLAFTNAQSPPVDCPNLTLDTFQGYFADPHVFAPLGLAERNSTPTYGQLFTAPIHSASTYLKKVSLSITSHGYAGNETSVILVRFYVTMVDSSTLLPIAPVLFTSSEIAVSMPGGDEGENIVSFDIAPTVLVASGQKYAFFVSVLGQTEATIGNTRAAFAENANANGNNFFIYNNRGDLTFEQLLATDDWVVHNVAASLAYTAEFESLECPASNGNVIGDPHLTLLSGLVVTYVGCSDSVLLHDAPSGFNLQARYCMRGGDASSTCAVALRCPYDNSVFEVYALPTSVKARLSNEDLVLKGEQSWTSGALTLDRKTGSFVATCSSGVSIEVTLREASAGLYFDLSISGVRSRTAAGLLGSFGSNMDEGIVYRNGNTWNAGHGLDYVSAVDHPELHNVQDSWNVLPHENLFSLTSVQSSSTCHTSQRRTLMQAALADDNVAATAEEACRASGLSGVTLRLCIFDFAASRDPAYIKHYVDRQMRR